MKILVALVVVVAAVVLWGMAFPARPAEHRDLGPARMRAMIDMLFFRGYDGGMMFLEIHGSERFLQVRKRIRSKGDVTLSTDFPLTEWSASYYPLVRTYLDAAGISYREVEGA